MEALILGWYILTETGSVESLVLFASLAWLGSLFSPFFVIAAAAGVMRPSDMMVRQVLVAQSMQPYMLMGALAVARTTSDMARVVGALAGMGSVALMGMGPAYAIVTALYVGSFLLSLGEIGAPPAHEASATKTLAGLKQAVAYVWRMPEQLGAFCVAFLVNLAAFPFFLGLLPYVANDVYRIGQTGLGWLAASWASGAISFVARRGDAALGLR
ncbi:MAG TPA: hypothetical protein VEU32_06910 [Burkholderiales bacterium]|nr:hypothetical protein [Burkholderiales bacterium]